ncbi:SLOG family protein [Bradyrhizobium sp. 930_D9_N1_4]|uniref:SLOG family protein n=1 Tax=Bradyrhizobium sp. 930_D9_N1_4 TaxID=3240374 RepID=UPI003F8B6C73
MMEQRVLVCGGRDYDDREQLFRVLDVAHMANPIVCLIHGAARGADALAADWALERDVLCNAYPADWGAHGNTAGPIRNRKMLEVGKPHIVIAFPGGKGTANMIKQSDAAGVPVVRVRAHAR